MTYYSNASVDWKHSYNILSCGMACPWDYATFKTCPSLVTVDFI